MATEEPETYRLCYVNENIAWFTTAALEDQWGDDWNDVPMECNAGVPYEWQVYRNVPPYKLMRLAFFCPELDMLYDVSVQQINQGLHTWLFTYDYKVAIPAGVTPEEFKRLVREAGGEVFVPEGEAEEQSCYTCKHHFTCRMGFNEPMSYGCRQFRYTSEGEIPPEINNGNGCRLWEQRED